MVAAHYLVTPTTTYNQQQNSTAAHHQHSVAMHNNYTLIALSGLFSTKQKTAMDEMPPKWLTAVHKHQPGVSFGPKRNNAKINQHNARLQNLRKKKKQKRSKFSWKKTNTSASSPTLGSPHGSNSTKQMVNKHIAFQSNSPKKCWFDQFSQPSEDDDASLYQDQFHFHLRQLAKQERSDVLDRDRRSWLKASPYIDRSIQRGLIEPPREHFLTQGISTADDKRMLYLNQRPVDSGRFNMAPVDSFASPSAVMRSNTRRMVYREPLQSGLGPPQVAAGPPSLIVTRPNYPSISFLASSRKQQVCSSDHKVQLMGTGRLPRGSNT